MVSAACHEGDQESGAIHTRHCANGSQEITPSATMGLTIRDALQRALDRNELMLRYQPQLNLLTARVAGVEALLRWRHPERGIVNPADFIVLAEASGLIAPIGEWVLRTACQQNKLWRDNGLPGLTIAVNVSARQFQQPDFHEIVARLLSEAGLDPQHLELEITESVAMYTEGPIPVGLGKLKALGVSLALDDFGTGYSSLRQLKCCPVSKLKVDQSFVNNLVRDVSDQAIVQTIIFLGQRLGMKVIAEGVETREQLALLRQYGCGEIQGFLLSKPVAADEIPRLVRQLDGKDVLHA